MPIRAVRAQEAPKSRVQLDPSEMTIGQLGVSLPTPLTTVNITASNVTDLCAWQVMVVYNEEVLRFDNTTASTFPFGGTIFGSLPSFFPPAVLKIDRFTHKSMVKIGGMLLGLVQGVNGSGLLGQLNFVGVSTGTTDLAIEVGGDLQNPDTYFINATGMQGSIPVLSFPDELVGAKVTVLGNGISMAFSSKEITIGESINMTGSLFPQEITNVVISYRTYSENTTPGEWQEIATLQTQRVDINETYWEARYSCTWKPEKEGAYQLKAEGGGYTSQLVKVTVSPGAYVYQPGIELYGPVAAVTVGAVGGFFMWDRRRRRSGRLILP